MKLTMKWNLSLKPKMNTISNKLYFLVFLLIFLFLVVQVINFANSKKAEGHINALYEDNTKAAILLGSSQNALWELRYGTPQFMVSPDGESRMKIIDAQRQWVQIFDENLAAYAKGNRTEEERTALKVLETNYKQYIEATPKWFELYGSGQTKTAAEWRDQTTSPFGAATVKGLEDLIKLQQTIGEQRQKAATGDLNTANNIILVVSILAILFGIASAILITRGIVRPIRQIMGSIAKDADGYITIKKVEIKSKDEMGELGAALNTFTDQVKSLIARVSSSAEQLAASSEQMTANAEQTTQTTNQIALAIQEVASGAETQGQGTADSVKAMKEMSTGIQRTAETVSTISEAAADSAKEAQQGNISLQKVIQQMDTINQSVEDTSTVVQQLGSRSSEIGKIIGVITEIATQTNLLSLNASIEAARAGEHGRGFAVVAEEVKKLAVQSKVSADQISGLIQQIQNDTQQAVKVMAKGTVDVETGMHVVKETNEGFERILKSVEHVANQIQDVSAMSEEMSASIQQVSASLEEVAYIAKESVDNTQRVASSSQEQLASMEEINASASSLTKMAEDLRLMIGTFKV